MPTADERATSALAPAAPEDLEALLPLLERFAASQGYVFDLAQTRAAHAGVRVGYAALTFGFSLEWGGRDAFIDEIYIEPVHRARGHARAALRALMAEPHALGVRALHLEVEAANVAVQALYRSEGFRGGERRLLSRRLS